MKSLLRVLEEKGKEMKTVEMLEQELSEKDLEIARLREQLQNKSSEQGLQMSCDQFLMEKCVDFMNEVNQGLTGFGSGSENVINIQSMVLMNNIEEIYLNAF